MTLARRIIPTVLVRDGHVVKGRGFAADRVVGNPVQTARVYAMREVDELVVLEVGGGRIDVELIRAISETLFIALAAGGGIRTIEQATALIAAGADKLVLTPRAGWQSPCLAEEIAARFGSQAVVACLDYVAGSPIELLAREVVAKGAGEVLLQSTSRDGTLAGYDLLLLARVRAAIPDTPLIISGGCGGYDDMAAALELGADAVAAGALWTFTDATPLEAKRFLTERGFPMRMEVRA